MAGRRDLGRDRVHAAGPLLVLKPGTRELVRSAGPELLRLTLLGGEPMEGPRYLSWNFVSSSSDRIEPAKDDWPRRSFPALPGEHECIPWTDEFSVGTVFWL